MVPTRRRPPGERGHGRVVASCSGGTTLGPFCAVVIGDHGLDVLSQGGVPLVAHTPSGRQSLSDGQTHLHDATALDLLIGEGSVDPLLTLGDGVVAADGFSLRGRCDGSPTMGCGCCPGSRSCATASAPVAASAPAAAAPSPAVPAEPSPAEMISLRDDTADDLPIAAPLPVAGAAQAGPDLPPRRRRCRPPMLRRAAAAQPPTPAPAAAVRGPKPVVVQGLKCSRGHFNDPRTRFCATCGIAMHQTSFILTEDVRPPLGVLVMSDGSYHTLVTSLVFGRDPDDDPEVREGRAQGVTLVDPGNTISRVHAEIRSSIGTYRHRRPRLDQRHVHLVGRTPTMGSTRSEPAGAPGTGVSTSRWPVDGHLRVVEPPEGLSPATARC